MSDYKKSLLGKFGLGAVKFNFDDLKLKKGEALPAEFAGQEIHIRKISGEQFEQFAAENEALKNDDGALKSSRFRGVRAKFIAMCLVDPDDNLVFDDADEANSHLNNEFIGACFLACQQVNGIGTKAEEEAEKN